MVDDDAQDAARREADALDFSRPLDVHRSSDFPEADAFVDDVYARCQNRMDTKIERKHFKVVLLDLYVAWLMHPDLKIAVAMGATAYKPKSRYNALRISKKVTDVVRLLDDAGLIHVKRGFYARSEEVGSGRLTRIWPSSELIALFKGCNLDSYKVGKAANEEVIILKNTKRQIVEYDDTPETCQMRQVVRDYNDLLARHFIDIRQLNEPWIPLSNGSRLVIGPARQRVHRVFNRSSFSDGGRFYGAWWQKCPKSWRREIFINDAPTIEQDYSSLHIALLYARKGINYYTDHEGDAYQLDTPSFLTTPQETRKYAKALTLIAINAKNPRATFNAFRSQRRKKGDQQGGSLKDKELLVLLDGIRRKHPAIADDLASDAGIRMMNDDSRITEHVIRRFTERGLPVLTIHDSYIVYWQSHDLLEQVLNEAFSMVTGMTGIRSERTGVAGDLSSWETDKLPQEAMTMSMGYMDRLLNWMINGNHGNMGQRLIGESLMPLLREMADE
ncbi:hypothetical protein [Bradyrhizobium sp. USDA 3650]